MLCCGLLPYKLPCTSASKESDKVDRRIPSLLVGMEFNMVGRIPSPLVGMESDMVGRIPSPLVGMESDMVGRRIPSPLVGIV